ncbi:MAG: hypothetical protein K1Y02_21175 [Candidatus Hydrogenedentes bacterium]|nr:hypothetical protein [Candidatus Hydrogenedentota bacterium]
MGEVPQGEGARRGWHAVEWFVAALAFAVVAYYGVGNKQGDHAYSRLATVYSLTTDGSWYIDRPEGQPPNPFEDYTVDKVMVRGIEEDGVVRGGRMISSKPPVLPLIMTGEFLAIRAATGWSLDDETQARRVLDVMTVTIMGGSFLLTLVFFLKTLRLFAIPPGVRLVLLVALAFGTQLMGFSTSISNHVPAAGVLMVASYFGLGLAAEKLAPVPARFVAFGFFGALVPELDMPLGVFVFFIGLSLLTRFPRQTLSWVLMGALPPLALHVAIMMAVTGSPLPVQMRKITYLFEDSYWRHPLGIDGLSEPKPVYLFHLTFGRCGVYALYPILLAGLAAGLKAVVNPNVKYRSLVLGGGLGVIVLTYYYVTRTNNYGGEAYGFRWFIGAMPILLLMAAPLLAGLRKRWQWAFVSMMMAISLYSGVECMRVGWESGKEWTSRIFGPPYVQVQDEK